MTITLTLPMVVFVISLLTGWTAFLLGAIKWLLNRQLIGLETKIAETDKKAGEAIDDLKQHKQSLVKELTGMRLEISQKLVCGNHQRMESDNTRQFGTLDKLNGYIQKLDGKLDGLINSMDLLMTHHINGGK